MSKPLSHAQLIFLRNCERMALRRDVYNAPGGYPSAWSDASRWYRTSKVLERAGLVKRQKAAAWLTDAGRDYLTGVKA